MLRHFSNRQLKIEEFGNLYRMKLNPNNRWVRLANCLPWDTLAKILTEKFADKGKFTYPARLIIGSIIIKHRLGLSDEETVNSIEENPYMQYFLGYDDFISQRPFDPSLFVSWRKIIGNNTFNKFTDTLMKICLPDNFVNTKDEVVDDKRETVKNKGKLKLDATVADQYITYPNDLGLLNKAREKTEKMIDVLFDHLRGELKIKPRTYRREARKRYLAQAKTKQKNKTKLRMTIRYQLNCLDRNLLSINKMLDMLPLNPLPHRTMRELWVIHTLNQQQRQMYNDKTNRCDHRIVSISQPHVRPIVRGKTGKRVEFGAKLGLTLDEGFAKTQTINWEAYRESSDLIPHVLAFKELHGYYPELVQVDKLYGTNENRKWCKERNIRMTVTPKGKPKEMTARQKKKYRNEYAERNAIEGKIGQTKQGYGLNQIKAKLKDTSLTWIGATVFTTNLVRFAEHFDFTF